MRALLEGLPDAIVGARRDGSIVFVNALAEELFGYTEAQLLGRPISGLWPERVRERYERNTALYFQLEHPLRFTARAYGLRRDGSEFIGEMSWGIIETDDEPMLLAVGRDITERLEAERRLRRQSDEQAAVAALGQVGRGAQHRLDVLRRLRRRESRRGRRGADGLALAAVLGGGHAAAARHALARARGTGTGEAALAPVG